MSGGGERWRWLGEPVRLRKSGGAAGRPMDRRGKGGEVAENVWFFIGFELSDCLAEGWGGKWCGLVFF
jgi:hypothetical protein